MDRRSRRDVLLAITAGRALVLGGMVASVAAVAASNAFPSIGSGAVFGEIALLRDVPRTATVTARTDALVYALDRDAFLTAVGGHRFSARSVDTLAAERAEREAAAPAV